MNLFPTLNAAPLGGLFDGLRAKLAEPAVKAGLLQAGMSMLNANPMQSPFAQIFSGINEGIQANQRYQDLATQRNIERQRLAAEKEKENRKFGLQVALANARMKQIDSSIRNSQENTKSLSGLRAAQTERAKRAPAGRASAPLTWDSYVREKLKTQIGDGVATPEQLSQWKQEFDSIQSIGGGSASGTANLGAPAAPSADFTQLSDETIQALADEQGLDFETARNILLGAQPKD